MRINGDITLFHYDEEREKFERFYFENVYVNFKQALSKSGIKQKGFYSADKAIVRIPTKGTIFASVGDYISMGRDTKDTPDRLSSLKITELSDNRQGTSPHYKIVCGG